MGIVNDAIACRVIVDESREFFRDEYIVTELYGEISKAIDEFSSKKKFPKKASDLIEETVYVYAMSRCFHHLAIEYIEDFLEQEAQEMMDSAYELVDRFRMLLDMLERDISAHAQNKLLKKIYDEAFENGQVRSRAYNLRLLKLTGRAYVVK